MSLTDKWLRYSIEVLLALALLAPPFFFGGREAKGQLVLAVLALSAAGLCVLRAALTGTRPISLRRSEVLIPLLGLMLSVLVWVRLPPAVVRILTPGVERLLPEWTNGTLTGLDTTGWPYLSFAPGLSRACTLQYVVYLLLFWTTLATVRSVAAVRRLFAVVFATGVAVALVGFCHYLFWNGKFYGLWELWWVPPDRHLRAPFTNRNHFSGYLALTLGPALAWLLWLLSRRSMSGNRYQANENARKTSLMKKEIGLVLAGAGVILIVANALLSLSRGGSLAAVLALIVASCGIFRASLGRGVGLAAVLLVGLAGLGLIFTFGAGQPFHRAQCLIGGDQSWEQVSGHRLSLWQADIHALIDFPLFGSGAGTHRYVYPLYLKQVRDVIFTHAENGYLQVLMENGLLGAILLGCGIVCVGRWCWRGLRDARRKCRDDLAVCIVAVGTSLLVALVHGCVDFVWYVPAYMSAVVILAGVAYNLRALSRCETLESESCTADDLARHSRNQIPSSFSASGGAPWATGMGVRGVGIQNQIPPSPSAAGGMGVSLLQGILGLGVAVSALLILPDILNQLRSESAWQKYQRLLRENESQGSAVLEHGKIEEQAHLLASACSHPTGNPEYFYSLALAEQQCFLAQLRPGEKPPHLIELRLALRDPAVAAKADWLPRFHACDRTLLQQARNHLLQALQCCPLLGAAYVRLAELSFLEPPFRTDPQPFCQEALLVRPHDPLICYEVGNECWLAGNIELAKRCWLWTCQLQPSYQERLLSALASHLPPEQVVDLLRPNFDGLLWLARQQHTRGDVAGQRYVVGLARQEIEHDTNRSKNPDAWADLHALFLETKQPAAAENCLRRAVTLTPFQTRYQLQLVRWLMKHDRWDEASDKLRQLRDRFPEHPDVRALCTKW